MFRIGKRTVVMAAGVAAAIAGLLGFGNALISAFEALSGTAQAIIEGSVGGGGLVMAYGASRKLE
jgi:hypothetical protein